MTRSLDQVVTAAAAELMAATAADATASCTRVLADVVSHLAVDVSFLRHNDHNIHATRLVAEWPVREVIPDPDPIGLIYFAEADPVFKMAESLKTPLILRPEPENDDYQRNIEAGTGVPQVSMACVPLLDGEVTSGILGFIKAGDRAWTDEELNALQAIATLFAQLQARIVAEEQLQYLAEHDDLSGLLNRRALIAHLDRRLDEGNPGPVAALFLDLDRLKTVNDYLGHNAGDQFIKLFAERLEAGTDAPAAIARVGGDEFVVVPDEPMDLEAADAFARRLQTWLQRRVVIDGEMLSRTVSIGVAVGFPGHDTTSDLLRRADQAALSAKSAGGSKTAVFTAEMAVQHAIRNDIELHLEGVIDEAGSALVLHYLPEVDMRTGEVLGTEALVRWRHPTRGLLLPGSFIGVAESINLAGKLGRLVMRSACADFARWKAHGLAENAILRVNVSPVQLVSDGFAATVAGILADFGLDGRSVCLEITESMVVQDIGATRHTLAALKDVGVRIAIDDFGTGYSVLTHLKSLPVDTLKIDRGFVRDLGENPGDLAIVRAILALAEAFELEVVAEGVETPAAARTLVTLGCPRAQGFMLSRPIDATAMEALFARRILPVDLAADN
ncbi:bifunctional diguanylate cyclase/phosphodiesterase [Mycolicibacterium sp. F2034L]|uniref:putative bifunctional diguanylate cyclase/phosphodiesterase n=1 Tax=Mycolicibacterium sp. F2034L TaxID=2926422 RepID=UPI001FF2D91B|nr:EAL domain-containing protein [Mycolicibacterium sp. F2034L]MCK0176895.1 EAL domain-containing protein [Mycolicibacterium sp. F2034L]